MLVYILCSGLIVKGEGSKELAQRGGARAFLLSSEIAGEGIPFPTLGTVKVYAKVGEKIYLGSSANKVGVGRIDVKAPNGATYSSLDASATGGLIANKTQENAGPLPNAGGYTPYILNVGAGQEGVWEINFVSPSPTTNPRTIGNNHPTTYSNTSGTSWGQLNSAAYVTAFDVSVRNTTNTDFISGRAFMNIFGGTMGGFSGFNGKFHVLTNDGYEYEVTNNGQAGYIFSFFSNNKGFLDNGEPIYKSLNGATNPIPVHDPRAADVGSDFTHKLFFNSPSLDLPATANTPLGSTWLRTPIKVLSVTDVTFEGVEGTPNVGGTFPLGGYIKFKTNEIGSYEINIDVDKNGLFNDPIDVALRGSTEPDGVNKVYWNGKDGLDGNVNGNFIIERNSLQVSLKGGEVHFPFIDVESNFGGIEIKRVNGSNDPDFTVHWDDSDITGNATTAPDPKKTSPYGENSQDNGHRYGVASAGTGNYGDNKSIDTWAYLVSTPEIPYLDITFKESDLEVLPITTTKVDYCVGEEITYTVTVRNNGPDNVVGAKFFFDYPSEFSVASVTPVFSSVNAGNVLVSSQINTSQYLATLNLINGATTVFTIKGALSAAPAGGMETKASVMRPADVTDPDATNPDNAIPTDPQGECNFNGLPCNNIKTHNNINLTGVNINIGANRTVVEGTSGVKIMTFPVTLSAYSNCDISVDYAVTHLTTNAADFVGPISGKLVIPANSTTGNISIEIATDNIIERNEEFRITISNASGNNVIDVSSAIGTIENDDEGIINITKVDGYEEGAIPAKLIFSFANGVTSDCDFEIDYRLGGTASWGGVDYVGTELNTAVISAGQTTFELILPVNNDNIVEGNETIFLSDIISTRCIRPEDGSIQLGYDIEINSTIPVITIFDNDKATLKISTPITQTEGNTGFTDFLFDITLDAPTSNPFTINFKTSDGTALISNNDYEAKSEVINFSGVPGTYPIIVRVVGDDIIESDEYFNVTISDLSTNYNGNLTITQAISIGNILNDDSGIIDISSIGTSEGGAAAQFIFTLRDGKVADSDVTLSYTLTGKANGNGVDYDKPQTGTITLLRGQNVAYLYLNTYDDNLVEGVEDVIITINSVSSPQISIPTNTSTLNIVDNNTANISVADVQVLEGNAGTTLLRFKALLTGRTDTDFTLPFTIQDVEATLGTDYTLSTISPISFSPNQATQEVNIDIAVNGDYDIEGNETLRLILGTPSKTFDGKLIIQSAPAIGTILEDDNGQITVTATNGNEQNSSPVTFTFAYPTGVTSATATEINFTLAGGSATPILDYTPPVLQVIIPAGQNSVSLNIPVIDDAIIEGTETIVLTPSPVLNNPGVIINTNPVTAEILDNDTGTITLTGAATVTEGDAGVNTTLTYKVRLDRAIQNAIQVSYRSADITAIAGEDYDGVLNNINFLPGLNDQEYDIDVTIRGDRKIEEDEIFRLLLSPLLNDFAGRITLANSFIETTIINDDSADIVITSINGIEGSQNARFTIGFENGYSSDVEINIPYTLAGSALNPGDYTGASSGVLTIPPGQSTVQLDLPIINDNLVEKTETITITLAGTTLPYNIALPELQRTLNVIDNDAASISIANASILEGDENDTYLVFDVTLTGGNIQDAFTLPFTITDGTAIVTEDYEVPISTTLSFNGPADRTKQIQVLVKGDLVIEKDETLNVALGVLSDVFEGRLTINNGTATGTIVNNDNGTIQVVAVDGNEEGAASGFFRFNFLNGATSDEPTTINFNLSGSAQNPADFTTTTPTSITIPAGATSAEVELRVIDDNIIENTESVIITTTTTIGTVYPTLINISNSPQTVAILDNDDGELLLTAQTSVIEGALGETKTITYKVKLTKATASPFSVNYSFTNLTAINGEDYIAADDTWNFVGTEGEEHEVTVTIIGDHKIEDPETFRFQFSNPLNLYNGSVSVPVNASVFTILNDDSAQLSIAKQDGEEGGNDGYFTISLPAGITVDKPITIDYTLSGTANAADYNALPLSVQLLANTNSINIPIQIINDLIIEGDEFVEIRASIATPLYGISLLNNTSTLKIADNDYGTITINNVEVNELNSGTNTLSFDVKLDAATQTNFDVNYYTSDITAIAGEDYEAVSLANGKVTFNGDKDEIRNIEIRYFGDTKVEKDEELRVILSALSKNFGGHLTINAPSTTGIAKLRNDDAAVVNVQASNGSEDGATGSFRFYLEDNATADEPIAITYSLGGSAINTTPKKDYDISHPTTVTIPAGQNYVDITVSVINDEIVEGTETVELENIQVFSNYSSNISLSPTLVSPNKAVLNITDNDEANIVLTALDKIIEGNNGPTFYQFSLELDKETSRNFIVEYFTTNGSATTADQDYVGVNSSQSFNGEKNETHIIQIQVNGDNKIEPDEYFTLTLRDAVGNFENRLKVPVKTKQVMIENDDFAEIEITSQNGAEQGTQAGSFTFSLTNGKTVDEDILINYTLDNTSTALLTNDFTFSLPSPLTLPRGSNSVTLNVNVVDDNIVEGAETVKIIAQTQNNPRNEIQINNTSASLDIEDNDNATITISNPEVIEGANGERDLTFVLGLNKPTQRPFNISYKTEDDTAVTPEDYIAVTDGLVSFPALSTANQTINIKVKGDQKLENDEFLKVILSSLSDNFGGKLMLPTAAAVGKITNDDSAVITISGTNGKEAGELAGVFKFSLPNNITSDQPIKINYTLSGDALGNNIDYTNALSGFVTIPANSSETTLSINVKDDNILEYNESVIINASIDNTTAYFGQISLSNNTHTIYIEDNDSATLTLSGASQILEGNDGFTPVVYTVTLSNPVTAGFKVNYEIDELSATMLDEDFQFSSGELTFSANNATSATFTVFVKGDNKIEANENFRIRLTPDQTFNNKLTVLGAPLLVEITNDDFGAISIRKEDGEESVLNDKPAKFIFSLPAGMSADQDIVLPYSLSVNSARGEGVDYVGNLTGNITLPKNTNEAVLTLPIVDDNVVENIETLTIQLSATPLPLGITLQESSKTLNILDNDEAYLTISNANVTEGNNGTSYLDFTVNLDKAVQESFTINYQTQDGTAIAGEDYQAIPLANGSITFNALSTDAKTIRVNVNTDLKIEEDETLNLVLQSLSNTFDGKLHLPIAAGVGTIVNDDAAIIAISGTNGKEAGQLPGTFKFSLLNNAKSDQPIKINYTLSGTALANNVDYNNANTGEIIIPANASEAILNINVKDDNIVEFNETVIITASIANETNYYPASIALQNNTYTINIEDNDTSILSLDGPLSVVEGDFGTKTLTFTATLSNPVNSSFLVRYQSVDGTATTADNDYQAIDGTLAFTGQTVNESYPIQVTINGDTKIEGNEFFEILLDPLAETYGNRLTFSGIPARAIINDDDNASINKLITISKQNGEEGINNASFTFSFPPGVSLDTDTEIFFSLAGTATKDTDYQIQGSATSIVIPAGQNSRTLNFVVANDLVVEGTETVRIITANIINSLYQDISIANPTEDLDILDNDNGTILVSPASVTEGNADTKELVFNVTLSNETSREIQLGYATQDNTATLADNDYLAIADGVIALGPQAETKQIKVLVNGDLNIEQDEILNLILKTLVDDFSGRLSIVNQSINGTIINDDASVITITKTDGEEGLSPVRFKFSFPDGVLSDEPTVVNYSLTGTAIANLDFTGNTTGSITILPYQNSAELVLPVIDDVLIEGDETVIISATLNSAYGTAITLNPVIPVANIKDNDSAKLKINGPITVTEGNIGTTAVNFTVTLEGNLGESFQVKYSTQDGTATVADNDYIPKIDQLLDFSGNPGESKTITIFVNGDSKLEANENFYVNLHDLSKTFNGLLTIENSPAIANILDDDNNPTNKIISITKTNGSEVDLSPVTFTFSFPVGVVSDAITTIPYSLLGSATGGLDYDGSVSGNISIPAGQNSATLILPVKTDNIVEGTETVRLVAGNVINGSYTGITVSNSTIDADIADANSTTLSISDIEITEGNTGTKNAIFTIKLNGATAQPFTVSYRTENGTASAADFDFVAAAGNISFNGLSGEERQVIVVIQGDKKLEADETFKLVLSNIQSNFNNRLTLERTEAVATIKNDDDLLITVTGINGAEAGTVPARFIFSLPVGYTSDIPTLINYTLAGQATAGGTDYNGNTNGVIAIPAGAENVILTLPVIDDEIIEKDEEISITINSLNTNYPSNITYNPVLPIVKIIDNDVTTLRLSNAVQLPEGNSGTTAFTYNLTLLKATGTGFTVKYTTVDGTATLADNDYNKVEGTLSFSGNVGESHSVTVFVNGDTKIEANEIFKFKIFDLDSTFNNRLTIPVSEVNGVIVNDDSSLITITKVDGIEGTQDGKFDLTLDPGVTSDSDITITYRLSGTATASDYQASPSATTVTIPAGENTVSIDLDIVDDDFLEERETVILSVLNIANPYNNVTVKQPIPVLYVYDNDITKLSIISPAPINEGHSGVTPVTFTLKLENTTDKGFSVQYTTVDGSATEADNDYQKKTGTLNFAGFAGETKTVSVLVNGDTKPEGHEFFGLQILNLLPDFDGKLVLDTNGRATILNDDIAPIAAEDNAIVVEDTPTIIDLLANDSHAEGLDSTSVTITVVPENGRLTIHPNGTVTYSPKQDYFGYDRFFYTVRDIFGRYSNEARVNITVTPVNDVPVANDDIYYVQRDSSIREKVSLNDYDVDGDVLIYNRISNPQHGIISLFDVNDGSFIYVPTEGFKGEDTFRYSIQDPEGLRDTAEVTLFIQPKIRVDLTPISGILIEGDSISITAKLTEFIYQDVNIVLNFNGTAEVNKDYTLSGNYDVITIAARDTVTTQKFSIQSLKDYLKEDPETIEVSIQSVDPSAFVNIGSGADIIIQDFYPGAGSLDPEANGDINPDPYMSPNGDGLGNEKFVIYNIERYPDNEVTIFNRWGNEVYTTKGYDNKDNVFTGIANKGIFAGGNSPLVDGVYYFIIKTIGNDGKPKRNKGYVIIRR